MAYEQHITDDSDKYQSNQMALRMESPQALYSQCSDWNLDGMEVHQWLGYKDRNCTEQGVLEQSRPA